MTRPEMDKEAVVLSLLDVEEPGPPDAAPSEAAVEAAEKVTVCTSSVRLRRIR